MAVSAYSARVDSAGNLLRAIDASPAQNHLNGSAIAANRPPVAVDGDGAYYFDMSDFFMLEPLVTPRSTEMINSPLTVMVALYFNDVNQASGTGGVWNLGSNTGGAPLRNTFLRREGPGADQNRLMSWDGVTTLQGPVVAGQTKLVVTLRYGLTAPYLTMRVNGANVVNVDASGPIDVNQGNFTLGYSFASSTRMNGRIYAARVFDQALSDDNALIGERAIAPAGLVF